MEKADTSLLEKELSTREGILRKQYELLSSSVVSEKTQVIASESSKDDEKSLSHE